MGSDEQLSEQELLDRAEEIAANNPNTDAADIIAKLRKENASRRIQYNETAQKLADAEAQLQQLTEQFQQASTQLESLSTTAETSTAELERITSAIEAANSRVIAGLPEDVQAIVPKGMDSISLREWLDTALPVLTAKKPAPPLNGAAGKVDRKDDAPVLSEEESIIAARLGIKPEDYAKYRGK